MVAEESVVTGVQLKLARTQAGLTQYDLSVKAGITPGREATGAARISEMEGDRRVIPAAVVTALDEVLAGAEWRSGPRSTTPVVSSLHNRVLRLERQLRQYMRYGKKGEK